ncbi:MAG: endonuclease [Frankiales bacterium]|nr:endonuclease [Frankiales bacterium]
MTTFADRPTLVRPPDAPSPPAETTVSDGGAVSAAAVLSEQICALAAQIDNATAELICLLGEFDAVEGWSGYGMKSCAHWLSWKCHIGAHAAREQVRVARALRDLPLLRAEFWAGRLSYAKVRALSRIADSDSEADLVALALAATAAQVEKTVSGWRRAAPSLDEPGSAREAAELTAAEQAKRELSWHFDDHGMLVVRARLGSDEAAVFLAAIERAQETLQRSDAKRTAPTTLTPNAADPDDAEPAEARPTALDGLVGLARAFVNGGAQRRTAEEEISRPPKHHLIVQLDAAVLQRELNGGLATYRSGGALTSEQARRLACDSRLSVVLFRGHGRRREILDAGRASRTVPVGLRRAAEARDGGCVMPGCQETRPSHLHAHHVWHWADGGPTCLDNVVMLCSKHHRAVHEEGQRVEHGPNGLVFHSSDGQRLEPVPSAPRAREGWLARRPPRPADWPQPLAASDIPSWKGEPYDLDYILSTLLSRLALRRRQRADFRERLAA